MRLSRHVAPWFEIPVTDMERAMKFYSHVLDVELKAFKFGIHTVAEIPSASGLRSGGDADDDISNDSGVGGADIVDGMLVCGRKYVPGENGVLLYLNGGPDLAVPLGRVEEAGGEVLTPKMPVGSRRYVAIFKDTEGNRIAFHQYNPAMPPFPD